MKYKKIEKNINEDEFFRQLLESIPLHTKIYVSIHMKMEILIYKIKKIIKKIILKIKRFFVVKGTWEWACNQMEKGLMVRRESASGTVHYKLDVENQRRVMWSFSRKNASPHIWENAYIFLGDFEATDWVIY
jgi:hypothetical protein